MKYQIIISLLCIEFVAANSDCECGSNEVFSETGNNACQNTCKHPSLSTYCKPRNSPGCICKEGYFKDPNGACVLPQECTSVCEENEVFDICGDVGCENTCKDPDLSSKVKCVGCNPGCICQSGYLRNKNNKCVLPKDCKSGCGGDKRATWNPCGDSCEKTCENRNSDTPCIDVCSPKGACVCNAGYVKNFNGTCVLEKRCHNCEKENEVVACKYNCDTTCANIAEDCHTDDKCSKCKVACYCKEGYLRNQDGECIPREKCPPKVCRDDDKAIVLKCGDPCPKTCENKHYYNNSNCSQPCIHNGCKCLDGYVLNQGKCINEADCPIPQCKVNEEYVFCPPVCPEHKCSNYRYGDFPKCDDSIKDCRQSACRCKSGYVRNNYDACVLISECCEDPNAEMVERPNPCPGGTCARPGYEKCYKKIPNHGCKCKVGYLKVSNYDETCIKASKCKY